RGPARAVGATRRQRRPRDQARHAERGRVAPGPYVPLHGLELLLLRGRLPGEAVPRLRRRMKIGIVVPFSWSYIGGVSEHAEAQAEALELLGFETRLIMGDDPPGTVWRLFHPDAGRLDRRPSRVMSIGTTVTVPANHSRTHIVLSQLAVFRMARLLRREKF